MRQFSSSRPQAWVMLLLPAVLACGAPATAADQAGPQDRSDQQPPVEWVDPATGHRVVRLSREPGSASLYFHQYAYSADGKKLVFTTGDGIWTVDLDTRELDQVVDGRVGVLMTGRRTGDIYFVRRGQRQGDGDRSRRSRRRGGEVYAVDLDTHAERHVASLPTEFATGNIAINADESMLVVVAVDPADEAQPRELPGGGGGLADRWAAGLPMVMYTVDVASGQWQVIHRSHDWLNHLQCSPTDSDQILFCHEGPWHYVDRTWLIRSDGSELTQVHPRTMDMEIAGHEFFSQDGKSVWYDLQTPRSLVFWLAGYDIDTGKRTWYHHQRDEWSVHYNVSPDGTLFAGDGGGSGSVANMSPNRERLDPPGNGAWIYLFRPEPITMEGLPEQAADQVKAGVLRSERLVNMADHDYDLEPNVSFTPDAEWIVFRSNMHGPTHVYAVEVAPADES